MSRDSAADENRLSALAGIRNAVEARSRDEKDYFAALLMTKKDRFTIRDLDIDAFADGVLAHRRGEPFHAFVAMELSPLAGLSWRMGWNERALKDRP